ncbi:hypothetical protein LPJ61_006987 [Coemansia biformis]|uniref:Uncharacterized protein n=1 Tax=Coemansia biformis TaxID=1286918 RepID=A0A9W7XT15_9FUNG|nr:hypothetical protein LPJ61_006987 [Coemansia biformis]
MNTLLNKAVKVCDTKTLETSDKETVADMMCDITVKSDRGWSNLCPKTVALVEHLCATGGIGDNEFFVKIDDDTIADPRVEDYIKSHLSGRDVFFGWVQATRLPMTNHHLWFHGPLYGFSASILKQIRQCRRPPCRKHVGEDQWIGYMLGECNITKELVQLPEGLIYHREYKVSRVSIKFQRYLD